MKSELEIADAAERFAKVAESFCSVVDSAPGHDRMQFVLRIYEVLPRLIGEAAGLPNVGLDSDESEDDSAPAIEAMHAEIQEDARLHHLQWKPLYGSLKDKFGDWDLYWAVFDPTTKTEAVGGSLAADIASVYLDLKDCLAMSGSAKNPESESVGEWCNGFYSHWGRHAIDALRVTHVLVWQRVS